MDLGWNLESADDTEMRSRRQIRLSHNLTFVLMYQKIESSFSAKRSYLCSTLLKTLGFVLKAYLNFEAEAAVHWLGTTNRIASCVTCDIYLKQLQLSSEEKHWSLILKCM